MSKTTYNTIPQIGPARFIPQALGAVAGGVGGFLKARSEAKAAGEKVTFKNAWDDVLLGAGKGALNPVGGAMGLATQGVNAINQEQQINENLANAGDAMQNSSVAQNPVFDPLSAATMKSLFVK